MNTNKNTKLNHFTDSLITMNKKFHKMTMKLHWRNDTKETKPVFLLFFFMSGTGQDKGVNELRVRLKFRARSESCSERRINRKRTWEVLVERDGKRRKFEIQGWGGETSKPLKAFGENISQQWRKPPGILLCASHHTDSESSWRKQPPLPLGRQQSGLLRGNAAPAATIQFAMTPVIWA